MARWRARLSYDGAAYAGFQRQAPGAVTVQGTVEAALSTLFRQPTTLVAAGRTDTGVHALGQVIAFDARWRHDTTKLLKAINAYLPPDIAVLDVAEAGPNFHPRYDAHSRIYHYLVLETPVRQPLLRHRTWQIYRALDADAMQAAADLLVGEHDFATFGHPPRGNNTVRVVFQSAWSSQQHPYGMLRTYVIEATAFLQHMVRRIVGMLVDVGTGKLSVAAFAAAFAACRVRSAQRLAAPQGLYLAQVRYADVP